MEWLNKAGGFVWVFIALLAGLALLSVVVLPLGNHVWAVFSANAMTLIAFGVVALAAVGIGKLVGGG